eukprot:c26160_g1_i1 orf=115-549(-)
MGSLMAGWDSPRLKSKHGPRFERSSSCTKEEIEEFWNKHKLAEQERLQAASALTEQLKRANQQDTPMEDRNSNSERDGETLASIEDDLEKLNSFNDWWTKSSWAFLNEPAMKRIEAANYKYKTQFQVADLANQAPPIPSFPHSL